MNAYQLHLAVSANAAHLAGFDHMAGILAKALRKELGLVEDSGGSVGTLPQPAEAPKRRFYGRFRLTEMDEDELSVVESPKGAS